MTQDDHGRVKIKKLPTGVQGLDDILGGGIPEFSFNIIAGMPGCGKTTLAHQFVFANASVEHPALYFTVLGEPAIKMLRYQQQYTFFDISRLNRSVRFINLSEALSAGGLEGVVEAIDREMQATNAAFVVVDSFRTVLRKEPEEGRINVQMFLQQLGMLLTSCEATSFLIGEYTESEVRDNPVFTVADGLLWLYQVTERNSVVRKLQVVKLRGQAPVPGLHTFRITDGGLQTFSRTMGLVGHPRTIPSPKRLSIGIPALDQMMGGGIPEGDSVLIAGPSGTGKSILGTQFIAEGIRQKEPGIVIVFEERPQEYTGRAASLGMDLREGAALGGLEVIYLRPLDLSVDETMQEILDAIKRLGARRLVIDSLAGFEMALAPGFREDFRESLYRMIFALTGIGVTILSTLELENSLNEFSLSSYSISFLTDDLIRLRYVEIEGQLRKILMVVKMRGGCHCKDIREYDITSTGLVIGERITGYEDLMTGLAHKVNRLGYTQATAENKSS